MATDEYLLSVTAEDKPGALIRVAGQFSRRGVNITRVAAEPGPTPGISVITLEFSVGGQVATILAKSIERLINVIEVKVIRVDPVYPCEGAELCRSMRRSS